MNALPELKERIRRYMDLMLAEDEAGVDAFLESLGEDDRDEVVEYLSFASNVIDPDGHDCGDGKFQRKPKPDCPHAMVTPFSRCDDCGEVL